MASILLIDDSFEARNVVTQILSKEHTINAVSNWAEANPYIFKGDLDLILMDINMPGVKGDKIAKILQETVTVKKLKIVLFSSIDLGELRQKAKEAGVAGYIQKTMNHGELLARVNLYLNQSFS